MSLIKAKIDAIKISALWRGPYLRAATALDKIQTEPISQATVTMAARSAGLTADKLLRKLAEKYFYDFSLYRMYFADKMDYTRYVLLRHNLMLVGGFYALMTIPFPFKAAFPTMGLCPNGYEGTFVCEPDRKKALEMYKEWRYGKKE